MDARNLLRGKLLYLRGVTDADIPQLAAWRNDPGLKRLTGPGAFVPVRAEDIAAENDDSTSQFAICLAGNQQLIGWIALTHISWTNRCAELAVYIGETIHQDKAQGTEAIGLLLDYAFNELNLHRVELEVVSYNERAKSAYRKLGFTKEGSKREYGQRDGQRYDLEIDGLLADEYRAKIGKN
jgi:RimJ/RimL family protein N-acetyltransferase